MSQNDLHRTIHNQDEQIRRLRWELQEKSASNYEQKYKKALRSIQEIIRANKQIKDELDNLRNMRQTDLEAFSNAQKEEFKKAYDSLLKDKNTYVLNMQTLQLENQKLKFTIAELQNQNQIGSDRKEQLFQLEDKRSSPTNDKISPQGSPLKAGSRDANQVLRQKQAEFHRTIANYEQHHSNLTRNNKRLEERVSELEIKLQNTQKNWRTKLQTKQLEVIDIKALTRQEFTDQISALRKENSSLKLGNNDLQLKIESLQRSTANNSKKGSENYDWEADLVQEMIAVKANLQPLRQQVGELQEMNFYEKEQSVRERTNLQTHVLELQAEVQRQNESIKNLERKILESHQVRASLQEKAHRLKTVEEDNKLLNGRVIVMQSREIALKNRTGEELEERILQFQSRVELLLSNKEGLKELREVGIHQLLALKAYILQLDSKLKELLSSNNHLLRKYKSYKERYQAALKEEKTYGMTVNTLKMKILGYDKLVLKLQGELESMVKINQQEVLIAARKPEEDGKTELYRKKYELAKEKLQVQQKYKEQQIQTVKLNYDARIMELTIKLEDMKSLRETIELYRTKNEQLQALISRRQSELFESKVSQSKAVVIEQTELSATNNRQTKDIINSLHLTIKANDQTIFKLQSELRTKEDNYKRNITKLQREISQLKEDHQRANNRKETDYNLALDHESIKNKAKVSDLQERLRLLQINQKEDQAKLVADLQTKIHKLQSRVQEVDAQREEQVFGRRRLQKQILDLGHDSQELQRANSELQLKLSQLRLLQRQNEQLRGKLYQSSKQSMRDSQVDYQFQGKDSIITKLKKEIIQLRSASGSAGEKDITISSLRNEIAYLSKDNQVLHDNIHTYTSQIAFLKGNIDLNKINYSSGMEDIVRDKDQLIATLRRDANSKDLAINQFQEERSKFEEAIRKLKRDLTETDLLKEQLQRLQTALFDESALKNRLRQDNADYDEEIERLKRELSFIKQGFQKQTYELLQSKDEVSKLKLEINNNITLRNKEQLESRFSEQIDEKDRIIAKLNADLQTLRNSLRTIQQDRDYHQESVKRSNNDIADFRAQINQLDQQNTQLRDQLYAKTQELNKLQFAAEGYRSQLQDYALKEEESFKIRNELFATRNQISVLQDEVYAKDSAAARISKELGYLKDRQNQLQEQLRTQRQANSRLAYQIGSLQTGDEESQSALQERDTIIVKLNSDLASVKNKYRQLQEEMEEREQAFGVFTQQLNKLKGTLSYYEDDLQGKDTQIDRLNRERQALRDQIEQLGQQITQKNLQVGRAKQETFALRMQASQREYQDKMRFDQEIFTYRSKITLLEQAIEDKDGELRRALIELEALRNKEQSTPRVDQGEVQDLRMELGKKQRQLINFKFELEDKQYQLDSANSNLGLLRATISDYQRQQEQDREHYNSQLRSRTQKERKLQQEVSVLTEELQRKAVYAEPSTVSYSITYTEEEMAAVNEQLSIKQRQLNSIQYELQDKVYLIQNLQSKIKIQQKLIRQLQEQREEGSRRSSQIQEFIKREKQYREPDIQQSKFQFKRQLPEEEVLSQSVQPDFEVNKAYHITTNTNLVTVNDQFNSPGLVDNYAYQRTLEQQVGNPIQQISEVQEQLETSQGFISNRRQQSQQLVQHAAPVPQISADPQGELSQESKDSFIKQLQKDKAAETQLGRITIKIQNNPQLAGQSPQYPPNTYLSPRTTFIPQPYPPFQTQPQYTRLPQSQSQVGRQTRLQEQQFVRYSQQVPFQSPPPSVVQTIIRPPIIGIPPPNVGQFRSF